MDVCPRQHCARPGWIGDRGLAICRFVSEILHVTPETDADLDHSVKIINPKDEEVTFLGFMSHLGGRRGVLHVRGRVKIDADKLEAAFAQAVTNRGMVYESEV
jgi:hypothetical protein